jgi:G3E family GTPase
MGTAGTRIPVTVLTGFLGAGKTTLLNRLVQQEGMSRVAVVINELGDIPIDHELVATSSENFSVLANGCICCSVRTDLQDTLRELFARRRSGDTFDFDRVLIETTGLADPAPVIQSFSSDGLIGAQYRLDGVVTLVDAVNGAGQLDRQPEAVKQAALADRLLLTKTDLAGPAAVAGLRERLRALNPGAALRDVLMGEVEPQFILDLGLASSRADAAALERFLGAPATGAAARPASAGEQAAAAGSYLGDRLPSRHDPGIRSFSLRFDAPFRWAVFAAAIDLLTALRGADLLRMKGIVNVEGEPVVVQGVQHLFHPAVTLAAWPSADRSSRLVFITRNIDAANVQALFAAASALAGAPLTEPAAAPATQPAGAPVTEPAGVRRGERTGDGA